MFHAVNENGEWESLYSKSNKELIQCRQSTYYCPNCREPLQIRLGQKVTPHFAHYPDSECRSGESREHETGKWRLYQWLVDQGLHAEMERYLPEIKQRPDVLLHYHKKCIAIEYQCATISRSEVIKRTESYHEANIFPLWIVGSKHLSKNWKTSTIQSTPFLQALLYYFRKQYQVFFFHPFHQTFHIAKHLQSVSHKKWVGKVQVLPLQGTTFPQLFTNNNAPLYFPNPLWEKLLYTHRTSYRQRVGSDEAQFRQYLYLNNYHFSLIPSIAYVPLPSQITMTAKPFIWQTRFLMKYFLHVPVGGLIKANIITGGITLNHYQADMRTEYMHLLECLGYVNKVGTNSWVKLKDAPFYQHCEQALQGDRLLVEALKKLHRI
ncbi:competence protein CoiA [Halobacillus salinus]|uniref:competence protein CoiA n=1 Tax=Halobacillus salinus TaxID=192814 RepID=UPI0009A5ACD9|nr:competence protein CoiA family protein [Halobacillus salinus]